MAIALAAPLTACDKEEPAKTGSGNSLKISVTADVENLTNIADTKTYLNGTDILWGENEKMEIVLIDPSDNTKGNFATSEATSEFNGKNQATFSFNIDEVSEASSYIYGGIYPDTDIDNDNPARYKMALPDIQNATAGSYDPDAYILVARPETFESPRTEWTASYRRATALNKITLTGIDEGIVSVEVTVPEGKDLAGRRYFDLSTGESGNIYYGGSNKITVNYLSALPQASADVWFTSWEVLIASGETMTVKATTSSKIYTKTITAREEGINFYESYLNTLTIDMSDASVEDVSRLEDGKYLIGAYSDGTWKIMTNVAGSNFFTSCETSVSTPVSDIECSDFYGIADINYFAWNVTAVENGYNIGNEFGYLSISGSDIEYSDSPAVLSVSANDDGTYSMTSPGGTYTLRFNTNKDQARFKPYNNNSFPYVVLIPWTDDPDYQPTSYKKAATVIGGKSYLIVIQDEDTYRAAIPIAADDNYGYLSAAAVTVENDIIPDFSSDYSFVIEGTAGNYTICQTDGRYLYQNEDYNSFNADASPVSGQYWTIEPQQDGTMKITNNAVSKYIQYSLQYNSYGSYADEQGIRPYLFEKIE